MPVARLLARSLLIGMSALTTADGAPIVQPQTMGEAFAGRFMAIVST
jgi:hypothetical protein